MSDVMVFGLVGGTHFIEDIQIDVPHGHQVTIPAEKALRSKDLWRAISSKQLFQIRVGPPTTAQTNPIVEVDLRVKSEQLELENQHLRVQQAESLSNQIESQKALAAMQGQLDLICKMLVSGGGIATGRLPAQRTESEVSMEIPTFIPSTITPEGIESRIESKKEESDSTLSGASGKLRELRQRSKQ